MDSDIISLTDSLGVRASRRAIFSSGTPARDASAPGKTRQCIVLSAKNMIPIDSDFLLTSFLQLGYICAIAISQKS